MNSVMQRNSITLTLCFFMGIIAGIALKPDPGEHLRMDSVAIDADELQTESPHEHRANTFVSDPQLNDTVGSSGNSETIEKYTGDQFMSLIEEQLSKPDTDKSKVNLRAITKLQPELLKHLLDKLPELEAGALRQKVTSLLIFAIATRKPPIEPYIIERMKGGGADLSWWRLVARIGTQTDEGREFFLEQLSFQSDPRKLQAAAKALARTNFYGTRMPTNADLEPYITAFNELRQHHDEQIRAATAQSIAQFLPKEPEARLHDALNDESIAVRVAATQVFVNHFSGSELLTRGILSNLNDKSLSVIERIQIATVVKHAQNLNIDLQEVEHISRQLESELLVYSDQEIERLSEELYRAISPENYD